MKNIRPKLFMGVFFIIMGTGFLLLGIKLLNDHTIPTEDKVDATGTVSRIETYRNTDNELRYNIYVRYIVDREIMEVKLPYSTNTLREGQKIRFFYDRNHPTRINTRTGSALNYLFPFIGSVFLLVGLGFTISEITAIRKIRLLPQTGRKIYAEYSGTFYNTKYAINGKHPYVVECRWTNTGNGKNYIFRSRNLWEDPKPIIQKRKITWFPVYIDPENDKYYVVDTGILDADAALKDL